MSANGFVIQSAELLSGVLRLGLAFASLAGSAFLAPPSAAGAGAAGLAGAALGGAEGAGNGHYVKPTVIADVAPTAKIAQEEIFGPVLALVRVKDFDEGLEVANNTEYGLTGSVFTNDAKRKEVAARRFHVGNFYINRKCTGALVGAHPFGGFNMSGTDSKAGGPDYLLQFLQAKTISEKVS